MQLVLRGVLQSHLLLVNPHNPNLNNQSMDNNNHMALISCKINSNN